MQITTILWFLVSVWIVCTDISHRLISNIQILSVIILGILCFFQYGLDINTWTSLGIFLIGFLLWHFGFLGAGDVKLLSILSLIMPYHLILSFLFLTSLIGAGIGIIIWILWHLFGINRTVPYGIAIMSSFLLLFLPKMIQKI
ncbi:prepilin peptidase [Helicobacter sp. 11S03491-1]|uniref:prepilin peptidase n=1 Tax=Helicobacter sp. 11S03491-1 TaxID=1476196 RepID=UPI000BA52379|nr:prepilin peptidase [Helicobacter sp. 11S03491-1]PAF43373.1 hypothetical protein BKH45_01665 [Helicobacter sp. 11S03491-1]